MIKHLLLCICFFSTFHFCLANTGWWFTGHKEGITIIVPCAYEDSVFERKQQEAFLNRLVEKLNRKDTSLKILLLVNPMIMYPGWGTENYWFATLGYDRLQEPDMEFIKDYYDYRSENRAGREHTFYNKPPSEKYKIDLPVPLDISVSYNDQVNVIGLKVICGYVHWDSVITYDRIYTLIKYGINHIEEIKKYQDTIHIPFWLKGMAVSINTLDTGIIKSQPLLSLGFDPKMPKKKEFSRKTIVVALGILLVMIFIVYQYVY